MVFKLWGLEPSGQNPFGLEFKPSFPLKPTVVLEFPAGIFPSEFPGNVTAFLGNPVGCRRSEEIPEFQWINWIYCWWQEGRRSPQDSPVRAVEGTDVPFVFWCPFLFLRVSWERRENFPRVFVSWAQFWYLQIQMVFFEGYLEYSSADSCREHPTELLKS